MKQFSDDQGTRVSFIVHQGSSRLYDTASPVPQVHAYAQHYFSPKILEICHGQMWKCAECNGSESDARKVSHPEAIGAFGTARTCKVAAGPSLVTAPTAHLPRESPTIRPGLDASSRRRVSPPSGIFEVKRGYSIRVRYLSWFDG